jgi:hypothetical protein
VTSSLGLSQNVRSGSCKAGRHSGLQSWNKPGNVL